MQMTLMSIYKTKPYPVKWEILENKAQQLSVSQRI